jgi:hypothetical protein
VSSGPRSAHDLRLELASSAQHDLNPDRWSSPIEWHDERGRLLARGGVADGRYQLDLRDTAVFEWTDESDVIRARAESEMAPEVLLEAFQRSVVPLVLHTRGVQVLHASAVLGPSGLCVLCARSGTGKSTLAYALSLWPKRTLWADDAVALDVSPTEVAAIPLPFSLRLRPASARYFDREAEPVIAGDPPGHPAPVSAVVVLERSADPNEAPALRRLRDAEAFTSVLEHAYCFDFEVPHTRAVAETYLELVGIVPVYSLRFGGDLVWVPSLVSQLEAITG